jgi:hypothetical protein
MTTHEVSPARRRDIVDALRRGTVPSAGLDLFAVGLDRFESAVDGELDAVAEGRAAFKAVRGEYGSGKTFFARWLAERAKRRGMAAAEIQISETETPLHRLETVYRRLAERLTTEAFAPSALRDIVDSWFYNLEEDAFAAGAGEADLAKRVDDLAEKRLADIARTTPAFSAALRAYRHAADSGDTALAEQLIAWIGGQPGVGAAAKRAAGVKGDLDHLGAFGFLQGLLKILRDSGHSGLLVVLDETETLQRVRSDVREKGLNALRQLVDEVDAGRFPGLYLVITGTPAFYDGRQGIQRSAPLAGRLATDFGDPRFDNPRAVQLRLTGFDLPKLAELGRGIRDLYAHGARPHVADRIDDAYVADFAAAVAGELGGKVGLAPRIFLKKLVDLLDKVDQFDDFDPRRDYRLALRALELTDDERNAMSPDDVRLEL